MFGFSFGKLIVLGIIIFVLWKGMALLTTLRDAIDERNRQDESKRKAQRSVSRATELFECPKCGTYVPNGTICASRERCVLKRAG